jgi:hypothetical protein
LECIWNLIRPIMRLQIHSLVKSAWNPTWLKWIMLSRNVRNSFGPTLKWAQWN